MGHTEILTSSHPMFQMTREMQQMVKNLQDGVRPQDDGMETILDAKLNKLSYVDFERLRKACVKLKVKSKDKKPLSSCTLGERLPWWF